MSDNKQKRIVAPLEIHYDNPEDIFAPKAVKKPEKATIYSRPANTMNTSGTVSKPAPAVSETVQQAGNAPRGMESQQQKVPMQDSKQPKKKERSFGGCLLKIICTAVIIYVLLLIFNMVKMASDNSDERRNAYINATAIPAASATVSPAETVKPTSTVKPVVTDKPVESATPAATAKPEQTAEPAETAEPEPTAEPETAKDPKKWALPSTMQKNKEKAAEKIDRSAENKVIYAKYGDAPCKLTFTNKNEYDCFVELIDERLKETIFSFFVASGTEFEMNSPQGTYTVQITTGTEWTGEEFKETIDTFSIDGMYSLSWKEECSLEYK